MPTIKRKYANLERNSRCPCDENDKREKPLKYKHCCLKEVQAKEQHGRMLIHHNKRLERAKKIVAKAIQNKKDHPILLPDGAVVTPGTSKIIIL